VSAYRAVAQLIENRVLRYPVHLHYNYQRDSLAANGKLLA
jgi:hypothetical protein